MAALQAASDRAVATLNQALSAYRAEEQRQAALGDRSREGIAQRGGARSREQAAAALAAELAADAADETGSVADCAATRRIGYPGGPWGGYANGLVPSSTLCPITGGGRLRPDAAAAFNRMSRAYAQAFGSPLCVSDSYRSYGSQVSVFRHRPSLAAVPGTSNHGWGLAVDLGCGIRKFAVGAISLDGGERRPVRLGASALGVSRPVRAVALGVRSPQWQRRYLTSRPLSYPLYAAFGAALADRSSDALLCCEYAAEQLCCECAPEQLCCEYAAEQSNRRG